LAAAALAVVATVVGATMLTSNEESAPVTAETAATAPAATSPISEPPATVTPTDPAVIAPATTETAGGIKRPEPGSAVPGVAFDQTPASGAQGGVEIVVKFKDDAKVKDIIDAFWKNQATARTKFEAFKAGKPQFAGLKLDRVTYSNELVLVDAGNAAPASRIAAMREIAAKLKSHPDISYADPNMTAHPGGQ
jgi:hypothetical protein